jgi:hypothetical protein
VKDGRAEREGERCAAQVRPPRAERYERDRSPGFVVVGASDERREHMGLVILLAILAIVLFGAGFVVKWLFILAAIAALLFLISLFTGGWRSRATY